MNHHGGKREARSDIKETEAHSNNIQVSPLNLFSRYEKVEFEEKSFMKTWYILEKKKNKLKDFNF